MTYQIGQIPTHYATPLLTYKVEVENPTGPVSGYSTLGEVAAAMLGTTSYILSSNTTLMQSSSTPATSTVVCLGHIPAGSLILVFASETTTGGAGSSAVTDSAGNTYTAVDTIFPNNSNANGFLKIWQCANCLEVKGFGWARYTAAATAKSAAVAFIAFSSPNATPLDAAATATLTGSGTTISLAEGTPGKAGEITIGVFLATGVNSNSFTAPTGDFSSTASATRGVFQMGYGQTNLLMYVAFLCNELGTARTLATSGTTSPWCAKIIALQ